MASNTPNLNLLKKDPVTDGNDTFNIETMLNENWDKIDEDKATQDAAFAAHLNDFTQFTNGGLFAANSEILGNSTSPENDLVNIPNRTFYFARIGNETGYPATYGSVYGYCVSDPYTYSWQIFHGPTANVMYRRYAISTTEWSPWYKIATSEQKDWINATLQNGWTGTLQYAKNDLEQVNLRTGGILTPGTLAPGTIIATLSYDYRPLSYTPILVYAASGGQYSTSGIYIANTGEIIIREPATTNLSSRGSININVTFQT